MHKSIIFIVLTSLLQTGCNSGRKYSVSNIPHIEMQNKIKQTLDKNAVDVKSQEAASHLTQCNRDLESLRTVSMTEYRRYLAEYDGLMKSSAGFMSVKDDISSEVAELARPKFQFALVNLCYRIKDALAQTLINQAGGR